ncbi:hypothetical protein [Paraburkholderia sp. BL25I1N1]|uniref:ORC-CDC6 family AAA ATPase n=1 Tax=Paraburkholderia sp. BL25I1N1 TaxID=1938804 RepID=UPI000D04D34C|nr:hypothetical protein [Paraburkholderia sp. BL25I1N1]PRY04414.1 hypothetical protein B0G73_11290 [Paraburkholderia sp. BL25I1N1]
MSQFATRAFAKNRAEELGFDLWDEFVIPLFFDKLALSDVRKPLLIEGGRGCGKTTLLRYLSHNTQLSPKRHLPREALPKQIGLYLRADTQYLRAFAGDWLNESEWRLAFEHALCLMVMGELFSALTSLASGPQRKIDFPGIEQLDLSIFQDFDSNGGASLNDLLVYVRRSKNRLAAWLNNPEDANRPRFLPLKSVLINLIQSARDQLEFLADVVFFVFIDEYENLLPYQMRVINTLLKHSEPPLIFHIAVKRNGMATRETLGTEQLQEPADYRTFDVEEHLNKDFELFAAEVFCFRLLKSGADIGGAKINSSVLCDPMQITYRRDNEEYRRSTRDLAHSFLPTMSYSQIAEHILDDATLRARLRKMIESALTDRSRDITANQFLRSATAMASVCSAAVLHQGKQPNAVLDELDAYEQGRPSKFSQGEWIHHYFVGTVLSIYLPLQRPCPLYAGFGAFLKLSRGNVRHFLELCHLSMVELDREPKLGESIPVEKQAIAARTASAMFVKETQGSGDQGNRLFLVVNTLGQIFRLSQQRPSQSEPERTHFSIDRGIPTGEAADIIKECIKWSVLFVSQETKVKDARFETDEYVLNPIYAPYFGISFNKGRKLELSQQAATDLLCGSRDQLDTLLRNYKKAWAVVEADQLPLL